MSFNDGFSNYSIPFVSPLPNTSSILISTPDGTGWEAAGIVDQAISSSVYVIETVETSGNIEGNGAPADKVRLKNNISLSSVTASFSGNGSQVTNITASNITNFTSDVRNQFSAGTNIDITNGNVSTVNVPTRSELSGAFTTPAQVTGAFAVVTAANATNAATASYVATGSAIPTFTSDVRNQFSAGANLTYSAGQFALNANVNTTSVTASFSGNGSQVTNITASNITNFTTDVRNQISGSQYVNYNTASGVVSLPYTGSTLGTTALILGQTATNISGINSINAISITGSLLSNRLVLSQSGVQTISNTTTAVAPTGPFHKITLTSNITLSTAIAQIVWPGAVSGDMLIIYNVPTSTGDLKFTRGATTKVALAGATVNLSQGGNISFIYDGTNWVEFGAIGGTSAP